MSFTKTDAQAPDGFYATEAAGLRWLGEAGGVPVAEVLAAGPTSIELTRLPRVPPTPAAALEFGRRLAVTHRAGAPHHGAAPPETPYPATGFIGPLKMPQLLEPDPAGWGAFYASCRVAPFAARAKATGALSGAAAGDVRELYRRLSAGDPDLTGPEVAPARLHGDLWSGNVLWTPTGAVLIDPAAHGGHPETDLAMLALFGLPYLDDVLAGYQAESPLAAGWQDRVGLHQLHPLLVHAVLFGRSYGVQVAALARRYV